LVFACSVDAAEERQVLQKVIWSLWFQGWGDAPDLVKACQASWALHNPDWTINCLSGETLRNYLSSSSEFDELYNKKLPLEALSDVIRNELLTKYGGIWADSTTYCLRPLNEWIGFAVSSGFFAFNRPGPDRMLSTWFLAATKDSYIPFEWLRRSYVYWENRIERDHYFWLHRIFAEAYDSDTKFRQNWDKTPKLSADGPHCFVPYNEQLFQPVSDFHRLIVETAQTPMLKLTHKLDHRSGGQGTFYRWICERVGI
jgi:hypothetical protein